MLKLRCLEVSKTIDFRDGFIIDPSVLRLFMSYEINMECIIETKIFIPDTLDDLIIKAKEDRESQKYLTRLINFFSYSSQRKIFSDYDWRKFYFAYNSLKEKDILKLIKREEVDLNIYEYCIDNLTNHNFYISEFHRINLLGDIVGKILGFSIRKSKLILMKTRMLPNLIREKISVLELPKPRKKVRYMMEKMEKFIEFKENKIQKIFKVPKYVKFFIGVIGLFDIDFIEKIGIILVFMDP